MPELQTPSVCENSTSRFDEWRDDFTLDASFGLWSAFQDEATSAALLDRGAPGSTGDGFALHVVAKGLRTTTKYVAGVRRALDSSGDFACLDLSGLSGIVFSAKGSAGRWGKLGVSIVTPESQMVDATPPGDCLEQATCPRRPARTCELTAGWSTYRIDRVDLSGTAGWNGRALALRFESMGPDFDFWLDDVELY